MVNKIDLTRGCKSLYCTGLLFSYTNGTFTEAQVYWKKELYAVASRSGWDESLPFLIITMPCKQSITYKTFEDIPAINVPCTCGNPNHWFVRYNKLKRR